MVTFGIILKMAPVNTTVAIIWQLWKKWVNFFFQHLVSLDRVKLKLMDTPYLFTLKDMADHFGSRSYDLDIVIGSRPSSSHDHQKFTDISDV